MKKIIFIITLGFLGTLIMAAPALAATVLLSRSSTAVVQGENFDMAVAIDSQGIKNYTAKILIQYPTELLEAISFTFGSGWMALAQAGYDSIDDARGVLIKTAGYPGGFFGPINFGTVSFLAKKPGNGIIKIGAASLVLDGANLNVFKDTFAQSSIEITSSQPPAEQTVPLVKEVVPAPAETAVPVPAPASTLVPVPVPSTRLTPTIFDILTQPGSEQSSGNLWIPILFGAVILVLAVGGYMIYRKRRKKVYNGK